MARALLRADGSESVPRAAAPYLATTGMSGKHSRAIKVDCLCLGVSRDEDVVNAAAWLGLAVASNRCRWLRMVRMARGTNSLAAAEDRETQVPRIDWQRGDGVFARS